MMEKGQSAITMQKEKPLSIIKKKFLKFFMDIMKVKIRKVRKISY